MLNSRFCPCSHHLDVFYNGSLSGLVLENTVKRYYAGGQQVATRMKDGTLSYHLNDPTGTSLVMIDENGDEDGQMVYDGFGMVMENTLSAELTGALLDVPDAATGLVHWGGGRWYDPALGRPLPLNLAGGRPTVPQALNRYAVTLVGQPGGAAAEYQRSASTRVSWQQYLLNTAKDETVAGVQWQQ